MASRDTSLPPTDPSREYSYTSFGEVIGRSRTWVRQSLVETGLVPYVVVNGQVRLTGRSLETYIELRDAGELEEYAAKK